jgi:hypothetical protein
MKRIFAAAILLHIFCIPVFAASRHHESISSCEHRAAKHGKERKAYVKRCLQEMKQRDRTEKMRRERRDYCNARAARVKGSERYAVLNSCLNNR